MPRPANDLDDGFRTGILLLLLGFAVVLTACRPACDLPGGEVLTSRPRVEIARPDLNAGLRKCLRARGLTAARSQDSTSPWSRFVRGDGSAIDNDAKIGALLVLRTTDCDGCDDEAMLADRATDALARARGRTEERYLASFLATLGGGEASPTVERAPVAPAPVREVRHTLGP